MKKKLYSSPAIKSEPLQVGVFGKYGQISIQPPVWGFRHRRRRR